ncbi:glycoside hydrolase family 92 protein [Sphingomonas sp. S1-29]|uniref:glycoside hydrolase domain-containing protein n=1 Tax=Sphingomonas sp. S1-29 TaxID=2991074 RepID=UPI002240B951|nr:glycoside hydrolase domain-containing protein [Sphingomonas sp. S1-29]UZK70563.1 glycoside hydrolase family 92 protein [Sphingomonas sp. S1-29]
MTRLGMWLLAFAAALLLALSGADAQAPGRIVDPFVGTLADFGQLSPAAVAPHGMVQLGPDTRPANFAGYDFAATHLVGFSHTRAVGVGCSGAGGDAVRTEHAGIVLLDFRRKGIVDFDAYAALAGMIAESATLARATPDEQIEAAYDDWAIAELAGDLGETAIAERFRAKALAYRPMWLATFRDLGADADIVKARGLYQGTLAQYRWAPVFDLPWLAEALGPRMRPELDRFFAENLFNMTNQPDIHVPYLFAWLGDPAATARLVSRYVNEPVPHRYVNSGVRPEPWIGRSFRLAPQGFADGMDDDQGTMSAWYIWATIGLYPLIPGQPQYVVTPPMASAKLRHQPRSSAAGKRTAITLGGKDAMRLNGRLLQGRFVSHQTIAP